MSNLPPLYFYKPPARHYDDLKPPGNSDHIQTHYGSSEDFEIPTGSDTTRMVPAACDNTCVDPSNHCLQALG